MHSRADSITVDLSTVKLASPFVTLRSIGEGFEVPASDALMNRDPVACGLLSEKEAERAVSMSVASFPTIVSLLTDKLVATSNDVTLALRSWTSGIADTL